MFRDSDHIAEALPNSYFSRAAQEPRRSAKTSGKAGRGRTDRAAFGAKVEALPQVRQHAAARLGIAVLFFGHLLQGLAKHDRDGAVSLRGEDFAPAQEAIGEST